MMKSESERFNPSSASLGCLVVNLNHEVIMPNNPINSDWQFRSAALPSGYAERQAVVQAKTVNAEKCKETGKEKRMFTDMHRGIKLDS